MDRNIRSRLDELKRKELHRLRLLARREHELANGAYAESGGWHRLRAASFYFLFFVWVMLLLPKSPSLISSTFSLYNFLLKNLSSMRRTACNYTACFVLVYFNKTHSTDCCSGWFIKMHDILGAFNHSSFQII